MGGFFMADDEIKPEGSSEEAKSEDKKEGRISSFFKKVGKKIDDATYDMRAESDYNRRHTKYTVYTGAGFLAHTAELYAEVYPEDNSIIAPGDDEEVRPGCVIVCEKTDEARYIELVSKTTVTYEFEGKTNEKPALKITLGEPAEKVDVIKVGDCYYLKK